MAKLSQNVSIVIKQKPRNFKNCVTIVEIEAAHQLPEIAAAVVVAARNRLLVVRQPIRYSSNRHSSVSADRPKPVRKIKKKRKTTVDCLRQTQVSEEIGRIRKSGFRSNTYVNAMRIWSLLIDMQLLCLLHLQCRGLLIILVRIVVASTAWIAIWIRIVLIRAR